MANLQIKGIQEELHAQIKALAAAENRSVAQEVVFLIKEHLAGRGGLRLRTSAEVLLELSGSWEDDRSAEEIISDIKAARRNSARLASGL
ncbi:MAG: hypothetical protein M0Z81_02575 [Deltaproteobacteria bacterium]|jgi:plasmid stability protein|nr:hypothetical protein [Deltaproteobacteria bacterium]